MADVTGRSYEAFVEFLLRRLGYRDEWTPGSGRQYLYERHPEALCHRSKGVCAHSLECSAFSKANMLPYGPWYDPDFFVLNESEPIACLHVTHWSNPRSSKYKFWRTIEDHFQYKTLFGRALLSVNLIFAAVDPKKEPTRVTDSLEVIPVHGWDAAIGTVAAVSFDSSILFPIDYEPVDQFVAALPDKVPSHAKQRRVFYNEIWERLYNSDNSIKRAIDHATRLLKKALNSPPNPRYTDAAIIRLQSACWQGRQQAVGLHTTETRYRKGLQHAFIVRELIARVFGNRIDADAALWSILAANPRFPWKNMRTVIGAGPSITDDGIEKLREQLASIPIQMDKRQPIFLLTGKAGLQHAEWNADFKQFILGLRNLEADDLLHFKAAVVELFEKYRQTYGMEYVLADLAELDRIPKKVEYVASRLTRGQ